MRNLAENRKEALSWCEVRYLNWKGLKGKISDQLIESMTIESSLSYMFPHTLQQWGKCCSVQHVLAQLWLTTVWIMSTSKYYYLPFSCDNMNRTSSYCTVALTWTGSCLTDHHHWAREVKGRVSLIFSFALILVFLISRSLILNIIGNRQENNHQLPK